MHQRTPLQTAPADTDGIGFFGKVPSHGDFVSTGLGRPFETELVNWLQAGLQETEQTLGSQWHRAFHAAPPWRFVIERSLWGQATMVGVLLPSMDRVGRSFPLVIAAKVSNFNGHPRLFCFDESWFTAAEALAETSTARDFDMTGFIGGLKRLRLPNARPASETATPANGDGSKVSLWWTVEGETGRASGFKTNGAPGAGDFVKLVKGGQPTVNPPSKSTVAPDPVPEAPSVEPGPDLVVERGYATHAGTRLSVNADALLVSDSPRLFAIADGVGDGSGAVEAAKITTNTLAYSAACDTFEAQVQEVKGKLGRAHSLVQSVHTLSMAETPAASIVAVTLHGRALAVIWAGNARCYLLRDGMMRCLTRDHVAVGLRFALSRSIGARQQLVPEVLSDSVQPGDRLLLCSAALARVLDERTIADTLLEKPVKDAAGILVQEALIANVRDNISAIVVAIHPA